MSYPQLIFNLKNLRNNISEVKAMCNKKNIKIAGVTKGVFGDLKISKLFLDEGITQLASSRIDQLKKFKNKFDIETLQLRIPMLSELDKVLKYVDISLQSEIKTLKVLNKKAKEKSIKHKVVLMVDLGDLREGFFNEKNLIDVARWVFNCSNLKLAGIGTNLGCYGAIKPTYKNLSKLSNLATKIEKNITKKPLEIVSGGATTSLPLVIDGKIPEKINHLRVGEGILLARDLCDFWGYETKSLSKDTLSIKAEIIEVKDKASHPVGEIFIDAFGNQPTYEDKGIRKRALLALGKQDIGHHDKLIPKDKKIDLVGSSSDHLIIDVTDCKKDYQIGDILEFNLYYQAMLYSSMNSNIKKIYKKS